MRRAELGRPAPSRMRRAMAPARTHGVIAARSLVMASMLTFGVIRTAPPRVARMRAGVPWLGKRRHAGKSSGATAARTSRKSANRD